MPGRIPPLLRSAPLLLEGGESRRSGPLPTEGDGQGRVARFCAAVCPIVKSGRCETQCRKHAQAFSVLADTPQEQEPAENGSKLC